MEKLGQWDAQQSAYAQAAYQKAVAAGDPDPIGFVAQMTAESRLRKDAVSPAGAVGLGQFMPATAARFKVNPRDPFASMDAALKYRSYIRRFNAKRGIEGEQYVWSGYNAGEGNALKAATRFNETRDYIARINDYRPQIAERMSQPYTPLPAGGVAPDGQASPVMIAGSVGDLMRPRPPQIDATSLFRPTEVDNTVPQLHQMVASAWDGYVKDLFGSNAL